MKTKPLAHRRSQRGFTLIELIVSLGLISLVGVVAGGFLLPLRLTRQSNLETQGLTYARSYMEALKTRWINKSGYKPGNHLTSDRPVVAYDTDTSAIQNAADVVVPASWTYTTTITPSTTTSGTVTTVSDVYRTVKVTVKPPGDQGTVVLTTRVVQP
jgi:prepilin-type N-terminal cleavage/methylation domain-containing protein